LRYRRTFRNGRSHCDRQERNAISQSLRLRVDDRKTISLVACLLGGQHRMHGKVALIVSKRRRRFSPFEFAFGEREELAGQRVPSIPLRNQGTCFAKLPFDHEREASIKLL